MLTTNKEVKAKILELFFHDGYGEVKVEMRILQRGQKEIIIHCGKQYRFVVDCQNRRKNESSQKKHSLKQK